MTKGGESGYVHNRLPHSRCVVSGGADFESVVAVQRDTPSGGSIKFGVGRLIWDDGRQHPAVAVQVNDQSGGVVTQFSLRMESFAVLLECMIDVFHQTPKDPLP